MLDKLLEEFFITVEVIRDDTLGGLRRLAIWASEDRAYPSSLTVAMAASMIWSR